MSQLLQWLNSARGPSLVEAGEEHDQRSALALVLTPEYLYDPNSSRVGLALVYKPTYVKAVSFGEAYFYLRTAVEAALGKIMDPLIMFVLLSGSSAVIPQPNDHPLFLDVSSPSYIEETGPLQRVQCFRGFKLHRAICLYAGESISHVAYPQLEGGRESHYMLPQRQKITPEILESLRVTVSLAPVDEGHWNIVNDPIYPACLDQFRERHEAASKNLTSQQFQVPDVNQMFGPMATPSGSTAPSPTPPSTLPLGSEDVNRIVQETLDTFHDLRIEAIQGMGAIREIDRSLSKGIMSEFLRLQLIVCNDLSKSLTSLRSEVGTLTQSLLRDLGLAVQSDQGTSSSSVVKAALQRFQDMMVLRMNLPLAQLDAARADMDDFLDLRLKEIRSREESTHIVDTLAKRVTEQHEKIRQMIQNAPLDDPRIAHHVSIGLSAEQPLEVTLFPGMLEGLLGHLKICSSDSEEMPHSMQAGAAKAWGEVVHEAAARSGIAQAFDGTPVESTLPLGLHVDYRSDFGRRHPAQVAEVFSDPQFLSESVRILFSLEQPGASPFSLPLKSLTTRAPTEPKASTAPQVVTATPLASAFKTLSESRTVPEPQVQFGSGTPMEPKAQLRPGPLASSRKSKQSSAPHQTGSHDVSIVMASTSTGVKATALTARVMPHPPKSAPFQARLISSTLEQPTSLAASILREDDDKTIMGGDFGDDDGDAIVMEGMGTEQDSAGASTVHQMSMTIEDDSDTDLFDDKEITNLGFEAAYSHSGGASCTNRSISSDTTELRCSDRNRSRDRVYQDDDDDIEEVPVKKARKDVSEDLKTPNDVRWGLYHKDFKSVDEV